MQNAECKIIFLGRYVSFAKLKNFAENTASAENNLYICREKTLNSAHYGTP